jgi:uncharacterized protein YndB with AHSA1/START domain
MPVTGGLEIKARGDREIVITRVFNAPRALVFDAFTKPALMKRWLYGPDGWSLPVCEVDLRVGGAYRYLWRDEGRGIEMGAHGTYKEVVPPERLVFTEQFDDPWYPGEAIGTLRLTENQGRTVLEQTMLYASREARDGVLASPMDEGMSQSYDRLAQLLESRRE